MKKLFYSAFVASMMLMASSCSQEAEVVDNPVSGEETQSVTFTIETGAVESRTAGDGKSVDQLHYEVWTNDNKLVISSIDGRDPSVAYKAVEVIDGKATVKLNLVRNVEYDVTFWAQRENGNPYNITNGLDKITYADNAKLSANKEEYDAFFYTYDNFKVGNGSQTIILNRPFAQINVGTTVEDFKNAKALGVDINKSKVTITKVHDSFNARTREASGDVTLSFGLNEILKETFQLKDENFDKYLPQDYQFLGMNYVFADQGHEALDELHTLTIDLNMNDNKINTLTVNNMPMQRNWRTNIVGQLITGDEEFQIIVDPEFDGEYNTHIWDGKSIHKPEFNAETKTWLITTAPELAWVASALNNGEDHEVNGRAAQMAKGFKGQTIKLAYDIDLNGKEWTPIGETFDNRFFGTFDGCGHTISNVNIAPSGKKDARGFFSYLSGATIQNLTLDNVSVDAGEGADAYAGALYGKSYGTINLKNVKVENSSVKGTNKVGGMVGFVAENQIIAENCHVINTNVETHNVTNESGLAGGFIGYIGCAEGKIKNSEISNCSVEGGIFTFINSTNSNKRSNGKFIGGIGGDAGEKITLTNCSATDITYNETTDYVSNCGELVGGCRGNFLLIVDGYTCAGSNEALLTALKENKERITISMEADLTVDISAWVENYYFGGENTQAITIEGNGHTLTFNHKNSDWNYIRCVNENAKWYINNTNLDNSGENGSSWNRHDIRFYNAVELNNVNSSKAIAVLNDATLKNVTIEDKRANDDYGLWITAEGQTVNLDGCTFNMVKEGNNTGRGIKIGDQYVDEPKLVTLNIKNTTFNTEAKAAVLVTSPAGAIINWGEDNVISNVAADSQFAVWVDEDKAAYADKVVVNGALCKIEGSGDAVVESSDDIATALQAINAEGETTLYLPNGTYVIPNAAQGKTVKFIGTGNPENTMIATENTTGSFEGCNYALDGSTVTFENISIKTPSTTYIGYARCKATYKNCIINGTYTLYDNSTFENCTFNVEGDVYNIWTWGAPTATFTGCTFNSDGKAMLLYGQANTKLTIENCTFNDNGGLTDLKAAIEIGNDYNTSYELIVNNTTVNGYEINDKGINTGTTLWANKNSMGKDKLNVVVDGVDVY